MTFDWTGFLDVARRLASEPGEAEEAERRCALSRAYYAAFHHSRLYLARIDPTLSIPTTGVAHEFVPDHLKQPNRPKQAKNAARKLDHLKRLRKWADYESGKRERLADDVVGAIRDAEWILRNLTLHD